MEYYKRIAKDFRMHHLMVSLILSVIVSALIFAFMIVTGNGSQWINGLIVTAGIVVAFCLAGLIIASMTNGRIRRRIKACQGASAIENEILTPCAKELSYGSEWLIYHHDNTYLFWTKKNIQQIKVISQKKNHCVLAVYSTLHPEGEGLKCTAEPQAVEALLQWASQL